MTTAQRQRRPYPIVQRVYSLRYLLKELELADIPSLLVPFRGQMHPIQIGHLRDDEILKDPRIAVTNWQYKTTTREWIPVFHFVYSNQPNAVQLHEFLITQVSNPAASIREIFSEEETRLITFKGHPFYEDAPSIALEEKDFY